MIKKITASVVKVLRWLFTPVPETYQLPGLWMCGMY